VDLLDEESDEVQAVAAYYLEAGSEHANGRDPNDTGGDHPIVYDPRLGLAVEALPEEITLEQLWRVV
jgi:hypothetical protein